MMKMNLFWLLIVFCPAVSWAQTYQYRAVLDDKGDYVLRWNVLPDQKDLEMRFEVKTMGWISFMIESRDGSYADVFFGGYDDSTNLAYYGDYYFNLTTTGHLLPVYDASQDLVLQGASYDRATNITTLILKRSQNTEDREDVAIVCSTMKLGWSFNGVSDDPADPHTVAGFVNLALVPC